MLRIYFIIGYSLIKEGSIFFVFLLHFLFPFFSNSWKVFTNRIYVFLLIVIVILRLFTEKKAIVHPGRNAESLTTFSLLASFLFGEIPAGVGIVYSGNLPFILPKPAGGPVTYRAVSIFSFFFFFFPTIGATRGRKTRLIFEISFWPVSKSGRVHSEGAFLRCNRSALDDKSDSNRANRPVEIMEGQVVRARRRWDRKNRGFRFSLYSPVPAIVANRRLAVSIKVLVARRICRPGEKRISHPGLWKGIDFSGFKWKVRSYVSRQSRTSQTWNPALCRERKNERSIQLVVKGIVETPRWRQASLHLSSANVATIRRQDRYA